jgi:hypothetical protein
MSSSDDWKLSTDIYDIVESVDNLKKRYIDDEEETTLALGIFGFITDTEAKKIQTSTIMTGQLGNEMFPTRANLTKNVLTHAIYNNIEDINAIPGHMTLNMGIKVSDLDKYMVNGKFVVDCTCPIFVGDYEFHFDYDIIIMRSQTAPDTFVYAAHYDMTEENRISDITDPYLKQPFVINIGNYSYLIFQALARQCTIEEIEDKIVTDSIVENKTYIFDFSNQIADFDVYVTDNGVETRIKPILYGSSSEGEENYCWYLFISDNTIRITFDSKSYIPGLNSDIRIKSYTTLGASGNFSYKKIDETYEGFYVDLTSTKYDYSKLTCYMVATTDSTDGSDKKTKDELQKLIPKAALSRGSITTETDLNNYFNLIDSPDNRLVLQKKIDNQLSRIWYGYFVLKDESGRIIPTNSVKLQLDITDGSMYKAEDGRYVLPAGSMICYNYESGLAKVIDESEIPELYSDEYFDSKNYYYMSVYNIIINPYPLYAAFYLTISNKNSFFIFNWVNEDSIVQFVANRCNFQRNLLTDQSLYKFTFSIAQSISSDFGLYSEEIVTETDSSGEDVTRTIITNNMKCIIVLYKDEVPYRWVEAQLTSFSSYNYVSSWELDLDTDNGLDDANRIKINNLHVARKRINEFNYGYFDPNTKVVLYTLAKFTEGEYGRYDLDSIAPGYDGYTVTNVYEVDGGIDFYENFTNVLNTKVEAINDEGTIYNITGVPSVGVHYMTTEENAAYLVEAISERKAYIEYCLELLENNMDIDFKFFNTYGPSYTYYIGDNKETMIGHVDLCMKFRASLKSTSDIYTKDDLISAIKEYIEDLYDIGDLHIPNLIAQLTSDFSSRINFIEFMNFNDFWLGVQHILKLDVDDPHITPEFLNIRNRYNDEGELEPCIDIEILY